MNWKGTKMAFFYTKGQMYVYVFEGHCIPIQLRNCGGHDLQKPDIIKTSYQIIRFKMSEHKYQIDQYSTVQDYVCSIFDSMPRVEIGKDTMLLKEKRETLIEKLLNQNVNYGNKIIELSEKFTSMYRKEHFVERKFIEYQLATIYKLAVKDDIGNWNAEEMSQIIVDALQQERRLKVPRISITQSRFEGYDPNNQCIKIINTNNYLEEFKPSNSDKQSPKKSRKKSIIPKKNREEEVSVKHILQVKSFFDNEQAKLRDFFEKINRLIENHKITTINIDVHKLKYSKVQNENVNENMLDFIKETTQNNTQNIGNIMLLLDLVNESFTKKLKLQGLADNKFNLYLKQIDRRQEVYSYAVSRMLEHLSNLKIMIRNDEGHSGISLIENLQDIGRKLYDLYPSNDILKNLTVDPKQRVLQQKRNQAVQVNTFKANGTHHDGKKHNIEVYRLQIKITEVLQRFQRNTKFRKTIQSKEIDKIFQLIRECMPGKPPSLSNSHATEITAYQEEFHKLIQFNQKNQKQMSELFTKKTKKYQKKILQFEINVQEYQTETKTVQQEKENQKKKYQKKLQIERSQVKKMQTQKQTCQKNISDMLKQIQKMRESIKHQNQCYTDSSKNLNVQKQALHKTLHDQNKKMTDLIEETRLQKERIIQERSIYKQKISLLEFREEEHKLTEQGLKSQLQVMARDTNRLREQVEQMTNLYEDKIKYVQEMIENIKELQQVKRANELEIEQFSESGNINRHQIANLQQQVQRKTKDIQRIQHQKAQYKQQSQKYRQMGLLNDSDIQVLKEEMEKVNRAYLEGQQQVQSIKSQMEELKEEKQKLIRQKIKLNRIVQDLESQIHITKMTKQVLQVSQRDLRDDLYHKMREATSSHKQIEQIKKEFGRIKKDLSQTKDHNSNYEKQLRELRQQCQKKKEMQNIQGGKKRIEVEAMKIQLRKKTEQCQKQRQTYEQKINVLTQKIKDMEQFITQKQLLARISNSHQTQ